MESITTFLSDNMYYVIAAMIFSAVVFYFTKDTIKSLLLGETSVQSPEDIAAQRDAQLKELQSMEARRAEEIAAQLQAQAQTQPQEEQYQDQPHEE